MKLNFFESSCQEAPLSNTLFGLCDDQDGRKAYTDVVNQSKWIATVKNEKERQLTFTAIDKCILKDNEAPDHGRCDGMLTSEEHLYFIELKTERKGWILGGIAQIESTIQLFLANHDMRIYTHKKAFICNKRHTRFQQVDNETNLQFFRKYNMRIDIQAEVIII